MQTLKDYFGKILQDEGQLELASLLDVREVKIKRVERAMEIDACTNHLFPPAWKLSLKEAIEEGLQRQITVDLNIAYNHTGEKNDVREDAWQLALDTEEKMHPMLIQLLKKQEAIISADGGIRLSLPSHQVGLLNHSGILRRLEQDMHQMT